jgi:hypothetical protein
MGITVSALCLSLTCWIASGGDARHQDDSDLDAGALGVHFDSPGTVLWSGRSAVLSFAVEHAPDADLEPTLTIEPPEAIEMLRSPSVLRGQTRGSLRVRAGAPGKASLTVGQARLEITIRDCPATARLRLPELAIVVPVSDAVVWGVFAGGAGDKLYV